MPRPAAFLDRDGVLAQEIVRDDGQANAPTALADFKILPSPASEVERLRTTGFVCVVVTNQPEITRGLLDPEVLEAIHQQLRGEVRVDGVMVCPHVDADG